MTGSKLGPCLIKPLLSFIGYEHNYPNELLID